MDYVDPDHPDRKKYLAEKFHERCATCAHWRGGYIDEAQTLLLERGFCNHLSNSPHGPDAPLRAIGTRDAVAIVTRHDFGCTEWVDGGDATP